MTAGALVARRTGRLRALSRWLLYRSDAWGLAAVITAVCLLVHDAVSGWSLALLAAISLMYWFGYAVNDWFDADDDANDPAKVGLNYFVDYPLAKAPFLGMVLATVVAIALVFSHWGFQGLGLFALYFVIMWSYSSPPFRFKHVPGVDLLMHAAFALTYPYLLCLVLLDLDVRRFDWLALVLLFVASLGAQLEQQLRDHDIDAQTGRTFTTAVGPDQAALLLRLSSVAVVGLAIAAVLVAASPLLLSPLLLLVVPTIALRLGFAAQHGRPTFLNGYLVAVALSYCLVLMIWSAAQNSAVL